MKIHPALKPWVKFLALGVGVIADGIMLFACFISQAHDDLSRVAFGAIAIMIVLLIPITYEEKAFKLWLCLVGVAVFFDTSYLLVTTSAKDAEVTTQTDAELSRLTNLANDAEMAVQEAQAKYNDALKDPSITRPTMIDLDRQLTQAREDSARKEAARRARYDLVESGKVMSQQVTAADIFDAIPQALQTGKILQSIIYSLIAVIIQGMIVFSLSEPTQKRTIMETVKGLMDRGKRVEPQAPWPNTPVPQDPFDDVSDDVYRSAAEYQDGTIRLPEDVAKILKISEAEAQMKHGRLFPGYVFNKDRYVKMR